MAKRHNRRSTRPLLDLPNLFEEEERREAAARDEQRLHIFQNPQPEPAAADDFRLPDSFATPPRRLRFISFGSGSSGNCSYIGTTDCGLLIDAGVDNNRVTAALAANGIDIATIRGILLTHDHADHVRYAYALMRRNRHLRLFATPRTIEGILRRHNISRRIQDYHEPIYKEHDYTFGDLHVTPFETSHDGTDNVGFAITLGETRFVVATDMGMITERADHYMRQATSLMIESNYDSGMLDTGPYPEYLKARIRSDRGHMDNSVTAQYLTRTYRPSLRHIFLCHLSHDNNTPQTAMATLLNALRTVGVFPATSTSGITDTTVLMTALPRYDSSDLFIL